MSESGKAERGAASEATAAAGREQRLGAVSYFKDGTDSSATPISSCSRIARRDEMRSSGANEGQFDLGAASEGTSLFGAAAFTRFYLLGSAAQLLRQTVSRLKIARAS